MYHGGMSGKGPARRVNATDARVRFGELLRSLHDGDVVIVKGGMAVARLSAIQHGWDDQEVGPHHISEKEAADVINEMNMRSGAGGAVAKAPEPNGIARMEAAARAGWAGMDTEATIANIYRWRDEGGSRSFSLDEGGEETPASGDDDGSSVSRRQRHLHWGPEEALRVADADDSEYRG